MKLSIHGAQAYFDGLPDNDRNSLLTIRKLIKRVWPSVQENMEWNMPSYHLRGYAFCALASQKNAMVFHVKPHDLLLPFKKELLTYDHGVSCIRFRSLDEGTLLLLDRVIRFTGDQLEQSTKLKKTVRHHT